jgi:hypothetical protein
MATILSASLPADLGSALDVEAKCKRARLGSDP